MKPKVPQKRKYDAAYRLRKKIGTTLLPRRSRIIHSSDAELIEKHAETKILLKEYGFIIKPELF